MLQERVKTETEESQKNFLHPEALWATGCTYPPFINFKRERERDLPMYIRGGTQKFPELLKKII
jgi:hypothetical protein